jgi:ATP-dependent DNA helicase RecQ
MTREEKNLDLQRKITELIESEGLKKPLVVLKGFDNQDSDKYLIQPIEQSLDSIDLDTMKQEALGDLIAKMNQPVDYWLVRAEEFSLITQSINVYQIVGDIVVLRNNLYDQQFPYQDTLSDIDKAYELLYLSEDMETSDEGKNLVEHVNFFYGQLNYSKSNNRYYVTFKADGLEDLKQFDYYDVAPISPELSEDVAEKIVELNDDELSFLDYVVTESFDMPVSFMVESLEDLPHNYLQRVSLLIELHPEISFNFVVQSIKRKYIERLPEYEEILQEVWGYPGFRDIEMYANIEKRDKELVEISQAQIIDDIVTEAENARRGEDYRDIYITASTGAGKSVMFQVPSLYLAKKYPDEKPLVLIISPLIGLMQDQVQSMKSLNVHNAQTINGNTPPYEKNKILQGIQEGTVDMLYLSPETLQARSDIKMLIGDRKLGMVIIDEAHIVTTWGKSFRADYWYLGIYLQNLRKEFDFPIVTFTATATFGGREDMYMDTRNSLNMISPISYFGNVKRDDILLKVRVGKGGKSTTPNEYRNDKMRLTLSFVENAIKNKQKSLIYFPTVKLLNEFYQHVERNSDISMDLIGKFYSRLGKEEKDTTLDSFKTGEHEIVLATKAFGMGIDIPDIWNVYHFSLTGNVVDYIQEIGRVARDHSKVPYGYGVLDYLPNDFNEVNRLQGMSAIRKEEILNVMKKIVEVYKAKNYNRNLVVSADDFKYIFSDNVDDVNSNLDNKVKTVLLMIEKDFASSKKFGYPPFQARPRSVFGNDLIMVTSQEKAELLSSQLGTYITPFMKLSGGGYYSEILSVDMVKIWEKHYKEMSFQQFKHHLFDKDSQGKLKHSSIFKKFNYGTGIEYEFSRETATVAAEYHKIMNAFEGFLSQYKVVDKQFTVADLGKYLSKTLKISDKFKARSLAQVLINAAFEFAKIKEIKILRERPVGKETLFAIFDSFDIFTKFVKDNINRLIKPSNNYSIENGKYTIFDNRSKLDREIAENILILGIGESFELLNYSVLGGSSPQISIRIRSIYQLERAIKEEQFYTNYILNDVRDKHYVGVEMQRYLFSHQSQGATVDEKIINYTKFFWENIENYFMGVLPDEVSAALKRN